MPAMYSVEWTIALASGPVVGRACCVDRIEASLAVSEAVRDASPSWSPEHESGVRKLQTLIRTTDAQLLHQPTRVTVPGIAVVITPM